jgi:hypothetical protein
MSELAAVPVAPVEWKSSDAASLARGRGLLRYADAVLYSVDEPVEGGRLAAAALLLRAAIDALTKSVEPTFSGPAPDHGFWASLSPQPLPGAWRTFAASEQPSERDVADVRTVAWAGLSKLEAPDRDRQWKWALRALKRVGLAALAVGVVVGIAALVRGRPPPPGLLAGKAFTTSSKLGRDSGNAKLLFHTDLQWRPWVEWDLGQPTRLHEVVVSNRSDCCDERALPLVVEVSDDRTRWTEVARRTEAFCRNLTIPFNETSARYLRLRVDRESFLHLEFAEAH